MENLENIIEAILFVAGGPVEKSIIMEKLQITKKELESAINKVDKKYSEESGIYLLKFRDKIQFSTNSTYAEEVSDVLQKVKERMLSKNVIETAAVIAYKQPITRAEIELTRGNVPSDYAIQMLMKQKLIQVVGRKEALGRPYLFGTTDEFLKRFNIEDINELPEYEETLKQIQLINNSVVEETKGIYNEFEVPEDEIIPEANLSKEDEEDSEHTDSEDAILNISEENFSDNYTYTSNLDDEISEDELPL